MEYFIPDNPKEDPYMDALSKLVESGMKVMKYKTMWELRFLEDEINRSDGSITVHDNGTVTTRGYLENNLADRIQEIIQNMKAP